jgi:hypothetical protein
MGTSLTGLTPATTYDALIKVGDNGPIDGTLKVISDGLGNDSVLALSTLSLQIGGSTGATWDNTNKRLGIGTATPGSTLDVHSAGAIVAQFNKTGSGNSYIQQLTAGAAKWKHGFTSASGAFDIIDDVNALTRLSLLNTGQLKLNAYTSTSAFTGTTAGFLAFDASGNILSVTSPATSPSGVSGAIQFSNGSAFASDATNFFWDNTNKRLGVGTNAPSATGHFKGSGSTSATTSLLVQNSAGSTAMEVKDNLTIGMGGAYVSGASGFGVSVASITASYPCFLMNSTGGGGSKIGFNMDTAKLYFSEETNGSTLFGHRIMADTRVGGLVVKNDTAAGAIAALNSSACLQADSTTRGFLPPRGTNTQMNAIASPATGLVFYDTTNNKLCVYNATSWIPLH